MSAHLSQPAELRETTARSIRIPALVIPVRPDGGPDRQQRLSALAIEVHPDRIRLRFDPGAAPTLHSVLVGLEVADGGRAYADMDCVQIVSSGVESLELDARFSSQGVGVLRLANLIPTFNQGSLRFRLGLPPEILGEWARVGVLRPVLWDRVDLCPRCMSLPSFRSGCRRCGSARTEIPRLIHHYACAHVGPADAFTRGDEIVCPKCLTRNLVVGADFEHLGGAHHCLDCGQSDSELEQIGQCLRCSFRFAGHEALHQDLIAYDVHRLDPLALFAGA